MTRLTKDYVLNLTEDEYQKIRKEDEKKYNCIRSMRCYYKNQMYNEKKKQQMREYQKNNKDKIRALNKSRYTKHKPKIEETTN